MTIYPLDTITNETLYTYHQITTKKKIKIFIAVQPVKVEMIQDNYTALQNTK